MEKAAKQTPKTLGLVYDAKHKTWHGNTDVGVVPAVLEILQNYRGESYVRWEANGYRYNRETDGSTTAYRV